MGSCAAKTSGAHQLGRSDRDVGGRAQRIAETYGTDATDYGNGLPILNLCYTVSVNPRFLNAAGIGTLPMWGQNSTGGWPTVTYKMLGISSVAQNRLTIAENSNLIVLWGCNYAWSKYGETQVTLHRAKERGAKIIAVDPWLNPGNAAFADEWVPVRPGTDITLLLAIAHELITQGWADEDFLSKHTVGYDEASLHARGLRDKEGNPMMRRTLKKDAQGKSGLWRRRSGRLGRGIRHRAGGWTGAPQIRQGEFQGLRAGHL